MPDKLGEILTSPEHTLIATDLGPTEGPLWHPEGYLTFVDLVGNRLQRWDQDTGVSVIRQNTGEGNGKTSDLDLLPKPALTANWRRQRLHL